MSFEAEFQSILRKQEQLRVSLAELDMELARLWDAMEARKAAVLPEWEKAEEPPPIPAYVNLVPEPKEEIVLAAALETSAETPEAAPQPLPAFHRPEPEIMAAGSADENGQLEMRLGTYWFVRVGVLMLLTGFVFLANYAREHFFNALPPVGKVSILYGLAGTLLGVGLWLERGREELRNFARVLAAGGVAAVYYTTFAAYKVETLRVIESPLVAGFLLLFWAVVMIGVAQRRRSQSLALMAILMAYFTCVIIDRATLFSLFSALLLTGAGIFLLLRNRWIAVSFASLAGTYLTFAYWRSPQLIEWMSGLKPELGNFWAAYAFLLGYWILFSLAVFAAQADVFTEKRRTLFALLNNGAFLALGSLGMLRHYPDDYGAFLLAAGAALVALAALARKRFHDSDQLWRGYLIGGVLVITLGVVMHFTGFNIALVLAAESTVLLVASRNFGISFLRAASFGVAGLSVAYALNSEWRIYPGHGDGVPLLAALAQSLFLIGNGWIARRGRPLDALRRGGSYGTVLGLAVLVFAAVPDLPEPWQPALLALVALAVPFLWRPLGFPELAVFGQGLTVVGGLIFLNSPQVDSLLVAALPVWGVPLFLAYWWKSQASVSLLDTETRGVLRDLLTLIAVILSSAWLLRDVVDTRAHWLLIGPLLGVAVLVAGMRSGLPSLAAIGQAFTAIGMFAFASQIGKAGWAITLVPILLAAPAPFLFARLRPGPDFTPRDSAEVAMGTLLWRIVHFLPAAALVLTFAWVLEYVNAAWHALTFAGLALAFVPLTRRSTSPVVVIYALATLGMGLIVCGKDFLNPGPYGWQLGVFCLAPGLLGYLLGKERADLGAGLAVIAVLLGWRFLSGEIAARTDGFSLTVSWALYAFVLFGVGLALRERTYRWLSLAVLGAAMIRLLAFDVWALEPVPRIFSFIATGLVLVSLGFVYNRYQGFIRKYL